MKKLFLLGFLLICGCSKPTQVYLQTKYSTQLPRGARVLSVERVSDVIIDDWVEFDFTNNRMYYRILMHKQHAGNATTESMIILEQHLEQAEK